MTVPVVAARLVWALAGTGRGAFVSPSGREPVPHANVAAPNIVIPIRIPA